MSAPSSPIQSDSPTGRRRRSSVAHSIADFTEDLVLNHDPPVGFFAASASNIGRAPSLKDIRRGSFGQDGWQAGGSRRTTRSSRGQSAGSRDRPTVERDGHVETFAPLSEESTKGSADGLRLQTQLHKRTPTLPIEENAEYSAVEISTPVGSNSVERERTDHNRSTRPAAEKPQAEAGEEQSIRSSDSNKKPKPTWIKSTWIGLKAFFKWFFTPFGFFLTIYGLNVVAWGGMLFLLLCNASKYMCWAPTHTPENQKHMGDIAALNLPGPYYYNCNDINAPRRIWLEIDAQILNALFCVTGFGLAPWRFRDLYYLLRWRFASPKRGREAKLYGLRTLAGIHRGWFRLQGSDTLDTKSTREYLSELDASSSTEHNSPEIDVEANASSGLLAEPENDLRLPLPVSKKPDDPITLERAPPTAPWKLDFFIWSMAWNTFLQCGLCGFMWGYDRYARPGWATGFFIALACIIAGVGGFVSYLEGKKIKKIEGIWPKPEEQQSRETEGSELKEVRTGATGHESVHLAETKKDGDS